MVPGKRRSSTGVGPADAAATSPQAMSAVAYELLKRRITSGEWGGGVEIDDRLVAAELGTSRTPVREALLRLRSERFVDIVPRRAIRVAPVTLADMAQMYELLTALEVFAVELIARVGPDAKDLAALQRALRDMQRAVNAKDRNTWIDADEQFHRSLLRQCRNAHIADVGLWYRDRLQRGHVIALRLHPQRSPSLDAHTRLVELMAEGQVAAARTNHRTQRDRAGRELLACLAQAGLSQF